MTSISSISSGLQTTRPDLFSRLDANADGKVNKDEFVSGRPDDVSESQAANLFAAIDTEGTGSVTEDQLSQGLAKNRPSGDADSLGSNLSGATLAALLQILQDLSSTTGTQTTGDSSSDTVSATDAARPSASEMFSAMDTDSDGAVSKDEFLAAKPKDVSDDQALALYNSIDTEGTGSITLAQFEQSMPPAPGADQTASAGAPAAAPAGGGSGGSNSDDTTYDPLDTNQDGIISIQELMASMAQEAKESDSSGNSSLFSQLFDAIKSYTSHQNVTADTTSSLLTTA